MPLFGRKKSKDSITVTPSRASSNSPNNSPKSLSGASGASISDAPLGYSDKDVKNLPYVHRKVWKGNYETVKEITFGSGRFRKYKPKSLDGHGRSVVESLFIMTHCCEYLYNCNYKHRTPLHIASAKGNPNILQLLLDSDDDKIALPVVDKLGRTALQIVRQVYC